MGSSEAQKKASAQYNKKNIVQIALALNKNTDKVLIDKLNSVKSKRGYICDLIKKDIENSRHFDEKN